MKLKFHNVKVPVRPCPAVNVLEEDAGAINVFLHGEHLWTDTRFTGPFQAFYFCNGRLER